MTSKMRTALELAAPYFGGIPLAVAVTYGYIKMSGAVKEAGKDVSVGVQTGLEGAAKEEGAGKHMMAEGLEHLSAAVSFSWWQRVWGK